MKVRSRLLATSVFSAAALASVLPQAALAQDTQVEELVITGSRIRLQDFSSPNPVSTVTSEAIERSGITNVTDLMTSYPALVGSTDSQDLADAGNRGLVGLNLLNLRNLGEKRTLVLVDGRRHVAGEPGSSSVDTNAIPVALIDRVEVLTGGASAIYGADGVSGVVNFITKKNFEGLDVRTQYGWSDLGGGETAFVSVMGGKSFLEGRANITGLIEYSNTDALDPRDRDFTRPGNREVLVNNPTRYPDQNPGLNPADWGDTRLVFARDSRYIDTGLGGGVYTRADFDPNTLSGVSFYGDGTPWRDGIYVGGFSMLGGSGTPTDLFQTELTPGLERWTGYVSLNYDLAPGHRLFADVKYNNSKTAFTSQPTFDYGIFVPIDNPFIPAPILADAVAAGGLGNPNDTWLPGPGVLVARDNFDLGNVVREIERETFRTVIGVDGDLTETIGYNVSYVYGQTKENNLELNNRNNLRWFAAIDAVRDPASGQIVCRSSIDPTAVPAGDLFGTEVDPDVWAAVGTGGGCVPINIFGENAVSPEGRAWINGTAASSAKIEQHVVSAYVSGDSSGTFSLPAGPVGFVLGAEYRLEKSLFSPSAEELLGAQYGYDVTWLGQGAVESGEFDVYELFGELAVPIVRDLPFVQSLDLNLAYRFSDYSTISNTSTWNAGVQWRVTDDLMIRASRARAVRAPNISELFLPQVQTFRQIEDPCDSRNVEAGTQYRLANCTAALGFNPVDTQFINTTSSSVEGVVGGNPDLGPETGDTQTLGFVYTPSYVPGLSIALDYYRITLKDAVNLFTANNIIESCYDLPQPNEFCGLFTRDPSTQFVDSFQEFSINVSEYETAGFDLAVQYRLDPADFGVERDIGTFQFSLLANRLTKLQFTELEGADPSSELGYAGAPKWQANLDVTWTRNDWLVNYGFNWFDETKRYPDERRAAEPNYVPADYWTYSERATHDIQVQRNFMERYQGYAGVNNFTNQLPDRGTAGVAQTAAGAFTQGPSPVGPTGRFFYVGLKAKF